MTTPEPEMLSTRPRKGPPIVTIQLVDGTEIIVGWMPDKAFLVDYGGGELPPLVERIGDGNSYISRTAVEEKP